MPHLLVLVSSPLAVCGIHIALSRFIQVIGRNPSPQLVAIASIAIGSPVVGSFYGYSLLKYYPSDSGPLTAWFYGLLVYSLLSYSYFHLFNLSETARGIKILHEIFLAKSLPRQKLTQQYDANAIMRIRLERLVALKQLDKRSDGRYILSRWSFFYRFANLFIMAWGKLLGINWEKTTA